MNFKFDLFEKETVGTIMLSDKVRISDPCYSIDTWCAGTLENVLEGKYKCFAQRVDQGDWGVRIASIEVRYEDYMNIEPTEVQNIDVGVDSGQCGIYDLDYFIENREDKYGEDKWYSKVCDSTYKYVQNPDYIPFEKSEFWKDKYLSYTQFKSTCGLNSIEKGELLRKQIEHKELTDKEKQYLEQKNQLEEIENDYYKSYKKYYDKYKYNHELIGMFTASTLDDKCVVSSSGDGDGSYTCLVGRNNENKIVSIKIDYYYGYKGEDDEYDD